MQGTRPVLITFESFKDREDVLKNSKARFVVIFSIVFEINYIDLDDFMLYSNISIKSDLCFLLLSLTYNYPKGNKVTMQT